MRYRISAPGKNKNSAPMKWITFGWVCVRCYTIWAPGVRGYDRPNFTWDAIEPIAVMSRVISSEEAPFINVPLPLRPATGLAPKLVGSKPAVVDQEYQTPPIEGSVSAALVRRHLELLERCEKAEHYVMLDDHSKIRLERG